MTCIQILTTFASQRHSKSKLDFIQKQNCIFYLNYSKENKNKENYEKFHLENIIKWWRNKASNRYETLKKEGKIRNELEVWTGNKPIDIIR